MAQHITISLKGHTVLVTGANSGIGKAIALAFGQAGANVAVNYVVQPEAAEDVARQIRQAGGQAITVQADVSQEDHVQAMFQQVIAHFGTVDVLVNNAGLQRDAAFTEMSLDQWQKVIDVNLTGQFLCAREAAREFLRRGVVPERSVAAGKIICISSVHQEIPWAGHVNYAASKGGIHLFMESIAQELAPHKIRVNAIAPGAIKTPINYKAWSTPEAEKRLLELIPYGRVGDPEDIARVAVWLACDESDYITGATIFVDGGMTLYPGFSTNG